MASNARARSATSPGYSNDQRPALCRGRTLRPRPCPARRLGSIKARKLSKPSAVIMPAAGQGRGRSVRPRHSAGRWSLLYPGEVADRARALEAICWMLLKRYGVVFRELLTRESILPRWREVLIAFRRLEDRGQVRGGRFVSGFLGEQFAAPLAVESLRAIRQLQPSGEAMTLS